MTAQHPMSELLRCKATVGDEASKVDGLNNAADALDAMQARCDALNQSLADVMSYSGRSLPVMIKTIAEDTLAAERAHRERGS